MPKQHWWITLLQRTKAILRGRSADRELDEELRFHLECKIEEGLAQGLSPDAARHRAMRAIDGIEQRKEEMRDARRIHWFTDFIDDLRYAIRNLRRTPGFTAFVTITLGLGIGTNAAIFPLFDGLVLRPPPVPHPGNLVSLVGTSQDSAYENFSYREYLDLRDKTRSYSGVAANTDLLPVGFSIDARTAPRIMGALVVSANYFRVLEVEPTLGRGFRDDEDTAPGRDAVVVLGPTFWKREFSSDPSVIGRRIRLNGTDFTVIGVAPEKFTGAGVFDHPDLYIPLAMQAVFAANPQLNFREDRTDRELRVTARLKTSMSQARGEIVALAADLAREYPKAESHRSANVHTNFEMRTRSDQNEWKFATTVVVLAIAVLFVACTNVAGVLLSRGRTRTREIAIRLAIGAGRFRLIRLLLTESLVLAILGGATGIGIGYLGVKYWMHFKLPSDLPVSVPVELDLRVVWAGLAMTAFSAILCGIAPAVQSTKADLSTGLKTADVDMPGRRKPWSRDVLVASQVAVSLMLLTAAFLMVRGYQRSWEGGSGFSQDRLLMARFDPRIARYDTVQSQRFYTLLNERARAVPGVENAALTQNIPQGYYNWDTLAFVPEGRQMPRDRQNFTSTMDAVSEGFFETMGIPILRGRGFFATDTADAPKVAVVNDQFAAHFWPGQDAIGKRFRLNDSAGPLLEVVGVASTIKYESPQELPMDFVYLPYRQYPVPGMFLMVRSAGDPLALIESVRGVVRGLDPNLPLFESGSYSQLYEDQTIGGATVIMELVTTMGLVGLVLTITGLYGLVAYNVNRRTREIGIRMALGAGAMDVLRLVMRQGVLLVAIGTAAGIGMGFAVEKMLNAMLFNSGGIDVAAYGIVVPLMFLVTLLAAYVPARKAAQIAPTEALRYE